MVVCVALAAVASAIFQDQVKPTISAQPVFQDQVKRVRGRPQLPLPKCTMFALASPGRRVTQRYNQVYLPRKWALNL